MSFLGKPTVNELIDLTKVWDARVDDMLNTYIGFTSAWKAKDPGAFADWSSDWNTFFARWSKARDKANTFIQLHPLARDYTNAEDAWNLILRALQPVAGTNTKGSYDDLSNRLSAAGSAIKFSEAAKAQPTAPDVDLEVYKKADTATKQLESASKTTGKTLLIVGGVALVTLWVLRKVIGIPI